MEFYEKFTLMLSTWYMISLAFFMFYMINIKNRHPERFVLKEEKSLFTIICESGIFWCIILVNFIEIIGGMSSMLGIFLLYIYECYEFCILKIAKKYKVIFVCVYVTVPIVITVLAAVLP